MKFYNSNQLLKCIIVCKLNVNKIILNIKEKNLLEDLFYPVEAFQDLLSRFTSILHYSEDVARTPNIYRLLGYELS